MNQLDANNNNQITEIPISKLHAFEGHPYKVEDNEEMEALTESIRNNGIMTPLIIRPIYCTDEYEVISGHRRLYAAKKAGITDIPAFVHNIDRDAAAIELVDCNLHREHILPSEKAYAYKLKLDAISHQGQACGQNGHKSRDEISDTESGRTVQRYIRLTYLIPPLLRLMDEGKMALSVGVELSYLSEGQQRFISGFIEREDMTPSYSQAVRLHRVSESRNLGETKMQLILYEPKPNQREQIRLCRDDFREYFPDNYTDEDIKKDIAAGLELLYRKRIRDREER
ncbi:MAG: ParB/RepB/Spo0J family partition protein [Oscillospiraceae bacterium]|nr:ParB/RepB/Spo0J family partition protein [Oscillospiraceae bacterium]